MSSGGYPSSGRKHCTEEDQKLLKWIRQYRSQPIIIHDQYSTNPVDEQRETITNVPEIVHIPLKFQQFESSLDLPHAAAAIIRHSSSTTRTLVQSAVTGQYYNIEVSNQNLNDTATNRHDTNLKSDSTTSTWPV